MKKLLSLTLLAIAAIAFSQAADTAPEPMLEAKVVLGNAVKQAAASGKTVLVKFSASWCGWCHRMDGVLKQKEIQPIVDKYLVLATITTMENGDKKVLENPGSKELMESMGGKNSGIPFFAFYDGKGKMIANSMMPPANGKPAANVGCPYEPEEINHFMLILKKAAPKMTEAEAATIRAGFEALKKKDKPGSRG